jgi:N-acetyl-gamma-glutamyl-phosphate reductase
VLVAGASGFAGALAAHLLWQHPGFDLTGVTARTEAGQLLSDLYPRYRVPLMLEELDYTCHADVDAAIVAYPHAAAAPVVHDLLELGVRVIDLSADYRLADLQTYEDWYGAHPHPEHMQHSAYGLTELHRDSIADASLVANPGCYPTATVLSLAPLARADLLGDVVVDAKQGVAGVGRAPNYDTHYSFVGENLYPYKVAGHRHTPEMEEQLALLGADVKLQFQPHLAAFDQGQLTSAYVTPTRPVNDDELAGLFAAAYADEPFIELVTSPPGIREVRDTNFCRIHAVCDHHTGKVLVFAALDNLWKGTSSQAVQNLNLMFGLPEATGLL